MSEDTSRLGPDKALMDRAEEVFGCVGSVPFVKVTVVMDPSGMITKLAHLYADDIARMLGVRGGNAIMDMNEKNLLRYFRTALYARVLQVNSSWHEAKAHHLRAVTRTAGLPIVLANVLAQVGSAIDKDYGLRFVPKYEIDADDFMPADEFQAMSDQLRQLEDCGLKLVYGLPKDLDGSLAFMACEFCADDSSIRSYRRDHPVYGFYAAFFRNLQTAEVVVGPKRVLYGHIDMYEEYLREMVDLGTRSRSST